VANTADILGLLLLMSGGVWPRVVGYSGLAAALAWLVASCATSVELGDHARSSLHRVSIDRRVEQPPRMYYRGTSQAVQTTLLGPVLGTVAAEASARTPAAELVAVMQRAHIDLGRLDPLKDQSCSK
jgi:hypothetical protein